MTTFRTRMVAVAFLVLGGVVACGGDGDGGGTEADRVGIAAECGTTDDCATYELADGGEDQLECLMDFKGNYCGLAGCEDGTDCPDGALCIHHDNGTNYCFRKCLDKSECNANRTPEFEANCSSNFDWANAADDDGSKACIPPSGK